MTGRGVAIVTGGSRGIGRSIVEAMHRGGRAVLLTHSSSPAEAASLVEALSAGGPPVRALQVDVRDPAAPAATFDAAEALGHVDVLVNNAAVTGRLGAVVDLTDDTLDDLLATNLQAPVRMCREAARRWRGREQPSHIVNLSSVAARTGSPGEYVVYAATKAAVETLTVGLAKELAEHRIHVNAVAPGTIRTGIHARAGEPGRAERIGAGVPMRRPGEPVEVAHAVAWLVSPEASYVTGAVLEVTGGL